MTLTATCSRTRALGMLVAAAGLVAALPALAQDIKVWKYGSPAAERDYFGKINNAFPGGKVTSEPGDWENRTKELATATIAKKLPDVLSIDNTVLGSAIQSGSIVPLSKVAPEKIAAWKALYPSELWALGEYNKESYGMTTFVDLSPVIIYNGKMFAEAGIAAPKTWSELVAVAKKMTTRDRAGIVFAASATTLDADIIGSILPLNGGRWLDESGKAAAGGQALKDVFKLVADLTPSAPAGVTDMNFRDALQLFYQSRAAMVVTRSFAPIIQADYEVGPFPSVMIPFPAPDKVGGTYPAATFEAHAPFMFIVTSQARDTKLAAQYLDYWYDPAQHTGWDGSVVKGRVPASIAMLNSAGFAKQYPELSASWKAGKLFQNIVSVPSFPQYADVRRTLTKAIQGVVLGVTSPDEASKMVEDATKAAVGK
jgi:ABC-type glycerol-3-phosphate transport system substrate-binding protein